MQKPLKKTRRRSLYSNAIKATIGLAFCVSCTAQAATDTWQTASSSYDWVTGGNWSSGSAPGTSDIAQFGVDPTGSGQSHGVGVNFGGTVNNGTFTGAAGTLPDEAVGAISVSSARTSTQGSFFVGAEDAGASGSGYMTLNGATINSQANTILSDMSTQNLHLQSEVQSETTGTFGVVLGNVSNYVQTAAGTTSAAGPNIDIASTIDQANSGSSITLLGGGSATVLGGILDFSGADSFTGGLTAGASNGTQGGTLQFDATSSLPSTGSIVINTNSEILIDTAGTYGGVGQSLTLNGEGIAPSSSSNVSGAFRATAGVTWQGTVNLGSNSYITPTGSNILTFSGAVTDNGNQLQKQGSGTLILSSNSNNLTGSTNIGNGIVQVNSGSSLGTGSLQMAQSSTNNTGLTLNNSTQTIGSLSSAFSASSGTESQVITLNSTALTINQTTNGTFGLGTNSSTVSQTSTITGNGSVTLGAASTAALTLTGTQTFTGGTQVQGGTLLVDGQISGSTGTASVTGGTLGGSGTLGGLVTVGSLGTITTGAAAATIGKMTLQSGLNLNGGGTYLWDLGSEKDNATGAAGTDFDEISLTGGTLTLGGSAQLTLGFLNGVSPNTADSFWEGDHSWTIIGATGATGVGNFSGITDASYADGSFSTTVDGSGDVTLNYAVSVPEPSTFASIGIGAALLVWRRRRRA